MTLNPVIEPPFIHPPNPGHLLIIRTWRNQSNGPSPNDDWTQRNSVRWLVIGTNLERDKMGGLHE
jgi:hypothetical protein